MMGKRTRDRFWVLLIFVLVCCRGDDGRPEDVVVQTSVSPDPPCIGPATVVIALSSPEGEIITGARISLEGNMNHAGMVPVLAETTELTPGRYEAALEFTMGGDWFILAQIVLPDGRIFEHQVDIPDVGAACGTAVP